MPITKGVSISLCNTRRRGISTLPMNVNVNQNDFLGAFVTITTLRPRALTARKHTRGSLCLQLHRPNVAILTATRFMFAVFCIAVTHCIVAAAYFTYPRGLESWVEIVCSGDWTRTSCTHWVNMRRSGQHLTNWAIATLTLTLQRVSVAIQRGNAACHSWNTALYIRTRWHFLFSCVIDLW